MDNLKILLVEDDPSFALDVEILLAEMGHDLVAKIDNGCDALNFILSEQPDIVIMDIGLKGSLSGIEVAKRVGHLQIPIVFTTAFKEKSTFEAAMETYSFGYLVKPFDKLTLRSTLKQAAKAVCKQSDLEEQTGASEDETILTDSLLVKRSNTLHKVRLDEINYIRSEGNYCTLYTEKRKFVLKTSLKKMLEELPLEHFSPVHKSFVVQLDKIGSIDLKMNKLMVGDKVLPLGRNFKNRLIERFKVLK
ncbi:MAG TPA: response regulator transcription factor [Bacteroidetes bacterium]|nr:response regulator transcription factor [Bacteroidota bacterium]